MSRNPNSKLDILDPQLAKQLAWRSTPPPETPAPPEPPQPAETQEPSDPETERRMAKIDAERCQELANDIQAAWASSSPRQQITATKRALRHAMRLGFGIFGMTDHPVETIRLLRLAARHAKQIPFMSRVGIELGWLPLATSHPEIPDLIVDVVLSANKDLDFILDMDMRRAAVEGKHPSLGKRLAEIVDTGTNWDSRAMALRWLALDDFQEAIPTLRRALRLPHARMRYYALFTLVQMRGMPLQDEDMQWLLDDAVLHPIGREDSTSGYERIHNYEEALLDALQKLPPRDGLRPLEIIANGGGSTVSRERPGLGAGWALEAIAAAYPNQALERIDRNLGTPGYISIYRTVDAIGRLPDDLARPRLLVAAAHTNATVVEQAKSMWFKRFGHECPVDRLAGVPIEVLAGPPSERMLTNLGVLRGTSKEARQAMIDILLTEIPDVEAAPENLDVQTREALAVLLFVFRTGGTSHKHATLGYLDTKTVAKFLVRRCGAIAFDVLVGYAEEGVRLGVRYGWLAALKGVAREKCLDAAQIERLRDIAHMVLTTTSSEYFESATALLHAVGTPPDLHDRLLALIVEEHAGREWRSTANSAYGALETCGDAPALDEKINAELTRAWQEQKWQVCDVLNMLAAKRKISPAMDLMMQMVDSFDGTRNDDSMTRRAFRELFEAKRISVERVLEILADPTHPLFDFAANMGHRDGPRAILDALAAVLDDTKHPRAAAQAACVLIWAKTLSTEDPRIERILESAPEMQRAECCDAMLYAEAPLDRIREHVITGLVSKDEAISYLVADSLFTRRPDGVDELFEEVLPKVSVKKARSLIRHHLGISETESYWYDVGDDDEDDEDDDLFDEDDEDDDDIPEGNA